MNVTRQTLLSGRLPEATVTADQVVGDAVVLVPMTGRNESLMIERPGGGIFVKVYGRRDSADAEAWTLELLQRPDTEARHHVPPRLQRVSEDVLWVSAIGSTTGLGDAHSTAAMLDPATATATAAALAAVHLTPLPDAPRTSLRPRFALFCTPTLEGYNQLSLANIQLIEAMQSLDGFAEQIAQVDGHWQTRHIVHGDLRLANVLVGTRASQPHVWLVDWETGGVGDPRWDLAQLIADDLLRWVGSMPHVPGAPTEELVRQATVPLEPIRAFIRQLLLHHAQLTGLPLDVPVLLEFVAAALVQTAFVFGDRAPTLTPHQLLLVQLADNCLGQPALAARELIGLP